MNSATPSSTRWMIAAPLLIGAALVVVGCLLPWLTLFAGLKRYPGLIGLNGRLLLLAGGMAGAVGMLLLRRYDHRLQLAAMLLGTGIVTFTAWILIGLMHMVHGGLNAMSVARPGPGLFVILAGGVLMLAPLALPARR